MNIEEYKDAVCTKCINCKEKFEKEDIVIREIDDGSGVKTQSFRCKNYIKWSKFINKSFEWYEGED